MPDLAAMVPSQSRVVSVVEILGMGPAALMRKSSTNGYLTKPAGICSPVRGERGGPQQGPVSLMAGGRLVATLSPLWGKGEKLVVAKENCWSVVHSAANVSSEGAISLP